MDMFYIGDLVNGDLEPFKSKAEADAAYKIMFEEGLKMEIETMQMLDEEEGDMQYNNNSWPENLACYDKDEIEAVATDRCNNFFYIRDEDTYL